jgi:hypothetical protein
VYKKPPLAIRKQQPHTLIIHHHKQERKQKNDELDGVRFASPFAFVFALKRGREREREREQKGSERKQAMGGLEEERGTFSMRWRTATIAARRRVAPAMKRETQGIQSAGWR